MMNSHNQTGATVVDITYTSDDVIDLPSDATDVVINEQVEKVVLADLTLEDLVGLVAMEEPQSLIILMVPELLQ